MKTLFTIFIYLFPFLLFSQDAIELSLKSGDFTLEKTLDIDDLDSDSYRLITFNTLLASSFSLIYSAFGFVDSPPTSMISAPWALIFFA